MNIWLSPLNQINVGDVFTFLAALVGFILAIAITVGVIFFVRKPLAKALEHLIGDAVIAQYGTTFALVLLGIEGLIVALRYISQSQLALMFGGLLNLLNGLAGDLQWIIYITALLFIGYSLRGWKGPSSQ